jgi:transposase-like protein
MPSQCPYEDCQAHVQGPSSRRFHLKDYYYRSSDGKRVPRFKCLHCKRSFSSARFCPCFRQKKRKLNSVIEELFSSTMSQRRIARVLGITRNTVVRKFLFIAAQAKMERMKRLNSLKKENKKLSRVFFDEMESFERSKCLPLSIPLVVDPESRKVLSFRVCSMPAKGLLAKISRQKYGPRKDERPESAYEVWNEIKDCLVDNPEVVTDQNPHYPQWIAPHFKSILHTTHKGRRGCVVGQGELKRGGFDPLFELNHTAAMFRANINRLLRRTWCTTKLKSRLQDHIEIYVSYHNRVLT